MTKYCCLDIGNVLVKVSFQSFLRKLSASLNISLEDCQFFLNHTQKLHDLGYTRMSDDLHDHFKIRSPVIVDDLVEEWKTVISNADYMLDFFNKLKKQHDLKIALLSNVGWDHAGFIDQLLNHDGFLNEVIKFFSCEIGARKPSLIYFQSFLQLHPEFQGAVYIDDLQENLNMGKQFGFKTYHFALDQIIGDNFDETIYARTLDKMEAFILGSN